MPGCDGCLMSTPNSPMNYACVVLTGRYLLLHRQLGTAFQGYPKHQGGSSPQQSADSCTLQVQVRKKVFCYNLEKTNSMSRHPSGAWWKFCVSHYCQRDCGNSPFVNHDNNQRGWNKQPNRGGRSGKGDVQNHIPLEAKSMEVGGTGEN